MREGEFGFQVQDVLSSLLTEIDNAAAQASELREWGRAEFSIFGNQRHFIENYYEWLEIISFEVKLLQTALK